MRKELIGQALWSARLKVYRADCHVAHLNDLVKLFIKDDFCTLTPQVHDNTLYVVLQPTKDLPPDFGLLIGDAFNNLRSALDHVIFGVVRANGRKTTRATFPFGGDRKSLTMAMNRTASAKKGWNAIIRQCDSAFADFIIDEIQPYEAGNEFLWSINRIDSYNKHRTIVPVVGEVTLQNVAFEVPGMSFKDETVATRLGHAFPGYAFQGRTTDDIKIHSHGNPAAEICFGEAFEVFAGEPVVPTALQALKVVSETLTTIERHFEIVHKSRPPSPSGALKIA